MMASKEEVLQFKGTTEAMASRAGRWSQTFCAAHSTCTTLQKVAALTTGVWFTQCLQREERPSYFSLHPYTQALRTFIR